MVCVWPPQTSMILRSRPALSFSISAATRLARVGSRYSSTYFTGVAPFVCSSLMVYVPLSYFANGDACMDQHDVARDNRFYQGDIDLFSSSFHLDQGSPVLRIYLDNGDGYCLI